VTGAEICPSLQARAEGIVTDAVLPPQQARAGGFVTDAAICPLQTIAASENKGDRERFTRTQAVAALTCQR